MIGSFARPWEISGPGRLINVPKDQVDPIKEILKVNGQFKSFHDMRQDRYERIIDETLFISRASEGAVSAEWVMDQPIFVREKYVKSFEKELKDRQAEFDKSSRKK